MDQGAQVHAHQPEVGTGLGHLTVLQQINQQDIVIVTPVKTHTPHINGFPNARQRKGNGYICITFKVFYRILVKVKDSMKQCLDPQSRMCYKEWTLHSGHGELWTHCGSIENRLLYKQTG